MTLRRNSRRKALKKEIFELGIRVQTEKQKYPKWFQEAHIKKIEDVVQEMSEYSDDELGDILASKSTRTYKSDVNMIRSALESWHSESKNIESKLGSVRADFSQQKAKLAALVEELREEGYIFDPIDLPDIADGVNPLVTLSDLEELYYGSRCYSMILQIYKRMRF